MTALIVDPALHSRGGHHFNATAALKAGLDRLGIASLCLVSAQADSATVTELGALPCFTRSVYGRSWNSPNEFRCAAQSAYGELSRGLRRLATTADLIILPCCDQILLDAVARDLQSRFAKPRVLLWLLYGPYPPYLHEVKLAQLSRRDCQLALAKLEKAVGRSSISIWCETEAMADLYRQITDLPIGVAPGPGLAFPVAGRGLSRRSPPTVTCVGFANEAKGYRLLPGALRELLSRKVEAQFKVHGVHRGSDSPDDSAIFANLASLAPHVSVRSNVLTSTQYASLLDDTDLLLLPYDPVVYRERGSGVFTEARRFGIPVVVPQECGFARSALSEGWAEAILTYDGAGLADAVERALARLDSLRSRARLAAESFEVPLVDILRAAVAGKEPQPPWWRRILR